MGGRGKGKGGEMGEDVEGPGKWSAPGPVLALGGPGGLMLFLYICFMSHPVGLRETRRKRTCSSADEIRRCNRNCCLVLPTRTLSACSQPAHAAFILCPSVIHRII